MTAKLSLAYLYVRSAFSRSRPCLSLRSAVPHYSNGAQRMTLSQLMSPLTFPSSGFDLTDASENIEEETLPTYKAEKYYPARIGEIFNDRYQIVGKLGYGVTSTVWLCRDLHEPRHVVLKLCVSSSKPNHEIRIYSHLNSVQSQSGHPGKNLFRQLYDSFEVIGPDGTHMCLVQQPLGLSLEQMLDLRPTGTLAIQLLKPPLRQILGGLDFLHSANIVHTDLQSRNMLLEIDDPNVFSVFEEAELKHPAPRKVLGDRVIYKSRRIPRTRCLPIITDFGEARFGDEDHRGQDIMPDVYRAPEVILKMNWDNKVDIWSIAMVFWDLVAGRTLFQARDDQRLLDDTLHLAEMVAIMGPPPREFLERSEMSSIWWDKNGQWRGFAPIPDISLERLADDLEGDNKKGLLEFLQRILCWMPEERPTAEELVFDPWLMEGLNLRKTT
ncbi:CMGC/SRPK protein kinase [Blastomyces dermatitidis ER-3]|uniref:non-specific serine/threonine protein kinase n=1 Tax=Ajellomyces dermatitidis (strain ER-3 / ATCC MYA-2586) TaxID=559297 RepID=A0ABP2ESP5_AJEDR|nr:CMGC/SRPK protein kinase [Blastomyces dermatitidis ER-3]EEQ86791.2 CMGC/SRPK protein kinase [Blastomyces dermatitidis ER-3]